MALIKCPECGKEISDKSKQCIHCGYPLKDMKESDFCLINGMQYDLSSYKQRIFSGTESEDIIRKDLYSEIGNGLIAHDLILQIKKTGKVPEIFTPSVSIKRTDPPQVRCPKCGSTQITAGARGVNAVWGFIGASKTVNRCMNCGLSWAPKKR